MGLVKEQGDPLKLPVPLLVNITVPEGGVATEAVSVTVTEQVLATSTFTVPGEHVSVELVMSRKAILWVT